MSLQNWNQNLKVASLNLTGVLRWNETKILLFFAIIKYKALFILQQLPVLVGMIMNVETWFCGSDLLTVMRDCKMMLCHKNMPLTWAGPSSDQAPSWLKISSCHFPNMSPWVYIWQQYPTCVSNPSGHLQYSCKAKIVFSFDQLSMNFLGYYHERSSNMDFAHCYSSQSLQYTHSFQHFVSINHNFWRQQLRRKYFCQYKLFWQ